eukprot:2972303-Ditylum_brightwellii.AAC.1
MGGVFRDPKGRLQYYRIHAIDDESQKLPLDEALPLIRDAALTGNTMLVHCRAGASRSASLVVASLVTHRALCLPHALAFVQSLRPIVEPNNGFLLQLVEFARSCGRGIDVPPTLDVSDGRVAVLDALEMETRVAANSLGNLEAIAKDISGPPMPHNYSPM